MRANAKSVAMSLFFGLNAALMTIIQFVAFAWGADLAIFSFVEGGSIVPAAFSDRIFFGDRLTPRRWLGIIVFLLSGWAILDFPDFKVLSALPGWFGLSIIIMLMLVLNETITRFLAKRREEAGVIIQETDPMVNNFWVGFSSTVVSMAILAAVIGFRGWKYALGYAIGFWLISAALGIEVLASISFKLLAYYEKHGEQATIVLKKFIMRSTLLVGSTFSGAIFFGEPLLFTKFIGILGLAATFILMDDQLWHMLLKQMRLR